MSAIAGIVYFDGSSIDRGAVERMTRLLAPYGRDAQHSWSGSSVALVHTLLRITPEDALDRQPLEDKASGTVTVFDGRLDNRDELADALHLSGGDASCMADSELVHRACVAWDTGAAERLLGDWTLACWRSARRRLWLARDPVGARPLFWHKQARFAAFATMPKALFAVPGVPRGICEERLADRLMLLPTLGPESFYKDIERVEPGQLVIIEGNTASTRRFHDFDPQRELSLARDDDYLEAFREQLDLAVARRIRTSGPVASHLSSGFDSSTITAVAAHQLGRRNRRLVAYTAVPREGFRGPVPRGRHGDEGPGACALAARFDNIEHVLMRPGDTSAVDNLHEETELRDLFTTNPANGVWVGAIERHAEQLGVKALLTGQLGNMTISYDGQHYLPQLVGRGEWKAWWREIVALRRRYALRRWLGFVVHSFSPYVPVPLWMAVDRARGKNTALHEFSAIHPEFARSMKHRIRLSGWEMSRRGWSDGRRARIAVVRRFDGGLYNVGANARGFETSDPTSDSRLIEFCLAVPYSQYLRNGHVRWLLQRLMGDVLPPEITESRTSGYQDADWFERTTAALPRIQQEVARLAAHKKVVEYLDMPALQEMLDNWPQGGWAKHKTISHYRLKLLRGIAMGTFIAYVEDSNR